MNNHQMVKILEDVINDVIGNDAITQLNKGIGSNTPWGKAILNLCEMKNFLKDKRKDVLLEEKEIV